MKFLLFILLFVSCGQRQTPSEAKTYSVAELTKAYGIPGIAAAVVENNEMSELVTYGVRKYGVPTPLEKNDPFHLGSCTKAMTATLAALLVEEGKISWTTTLGEVFPDIGMNTSFQKVSLETLLVHRAGLPVEHEVFHDVKKMSSLNGRIHITKVLLSQSPQFTPDSEYQYSNYNYIIAGHMLERITGESWETLMTTRLFNPLGMKSCGFGVTSILYQQEPTTPWGHIKLNGLIESRHFDNPSSFGPSSTVHCSLTDWSKFLIMHLNGFKGEDNILTKETYKKLHSIHPANDSTYTYGGWNLHERQWANGMTLSHTGSNTLNYAKVWLAPSKNAIIMSTANIGGDDAFYATDALIQQMIKKHLH